MKKVRSLFLSIFVLAFATLAHAEIREIKSMRELVALVDNDTMVVFDIDNTTLMPTQSLGSDQFFRYVLSKGEKQGMKGEAAFNWALATVTPLQPKSPVVAVEEMTPGMIHDFQDRGITLFALTARPEAWTPDTIRQLKSIDVDFSVTSPEASDLKGGIFFQKPGQDKGGELVDLLSRLKRRPKKLIFVDDRPNNVDSVDTAMNGTEIPHLSLRYGAADEWVKAFDTKVVELEWLVFSSTGRFVSDSEASKMLYQRASACW